MFRTTFDPYNQTWAVHFEDKELVAGLAEDQAMKLWSNLDELLEEFLTLEESELYDEDMAD